MCLCVGVSYPEGAVGHVNLTPGDDDGVFNRFDRSVHTQKCAVPFVGDLNVDGATFRVLGGNKTLSVWYCAASCNINDVFL